MTNQGRTSTTDRHPVSPAVVLRKTTDEACASRCDASAQMRVRGLFETHLTVADLARSVAFYRDVVGLPVALEVPDRGAAFHWIGQPGRAMLGLWSLGSAPMGMQLHIAFDMSLPDVVAAPEHLAARGVQPLSFFGEPTGEPSVIEWMPAAAVYFRDPDGHMLEYLAMLEGPARPELGIVSWSQRAAHPPDGHPGA
jgi:lactoylglutathione lyase